MYLWESPVYLVYDSGSEHTRDALTWYIIQLGLNFTWSIIFFTFRLFLFAFIWIIALWIAIFIMVRKFAKINKVSAHLQIPYLLWVTFAAVINFAIYLLN